MSTETQTTPSQPATRRASVASRILDPMIMKLRLLPFPARDRETFYAHWRRNLANESAIHRTIVHDGEVAGNIVSWEQDGKRLIGYWIGRDFWGKGVATRALAEFVAEVPQRPLHAWVAATNVGSIRVLEKCGFVMVDSRTTDVEELLYELS